MKSIRSLIACAGVALCAASALAQADFSKAPKVVILDDDKRASITIEGKDFGWYVWGDKTVGHPYWSNLHAPNGLQVTRTNPPDDEIDKDNTDHAEMHPGAWLSFGDLNGIDFWRNKGVVRQKGITLGPVSLRPTDAPGIDTVFEVENEWFASAETQKPIVREICQYTIRSAPAGWFLFVQTRLYPTFSGGLTFGDQEEMGFGVRVATPLTVKSTAGWMVNSNGARGEASVKGQAADWCYTMAAAPGGYAGIALMAHPTKKIPNWFHARDYGLMVANGFGRKAMTGADDVNMAPVKTTLQWTGLSYGLFIFGGPEQKPNFAAAYETFKKSIAPKSK